MVVDTSIKVQKTTRDRLYFIKGPDRDYDAAIVDLIEYYEHRAQSAKTYDPGLISNSKKEKVII